MAELIRGKVIEVLQKAFEARGELDHSEGRGSIGTLGLYTTFDEALAGVCGGAVQGSVGYVNLVQWVRYEGGVIQKITKEQWRGIRKDGNGSGHEDGFMDYRNEK